MAFERGPEDAAARIDAHLAALEDPGADTTLAGHAREVLEAVMELHGTGLNRLLERVATEGGDALLERLAEDPAIRPLLLLHGLHPLSTAERLEEALGGLRSSGLDAVLDSVAGETARIRLRAVEGAEGVTAHWIRRRVEDAVLDAAPELEGAELVGWAEVPAGTVLVAPPTREGS
ncbi:MAG TPA: hypothetical protein VKA48_12930 [Gammaproteobacteria bacterium]|nr:hypothetical protein [Gammaproteobacteria bacterium]